MPAQDLAATTETFFAALRARDFAACQAALATMAADDPEHSGWRDYLTGILAYEAARDWASAEAAFRRVVAAATEPLLSGRAWLALGRSLDAQGRWSEADTAFSAAQATYTALALPLEVAKALKQRAITLNNGFTRGDYGPDALGQALAHAEQALGCLAPLDQAETEVLWLTGSIWNTLGLIRRNTGELEAAAACYERDLVICRQLDDHYGAGLSYGNLGEIEQLRGPAHWPSALARYQEALASIRAFDDAYEEIEALANLGHLLALMGQPEAAQEHFAAAIRLIEHIRAGVAGEEARAGFFTTIADIFAHAVLLAVALGAHARAFAYAEQARARALLDLHAGVAEPAPVQAAPLGLAEVQARLPPGALLLAYFSCGLVEAPDERPIAGVQRHRFPPARILLFAVSAEQLLVVDTGLAPSALYPSSLDRVVERHFLDPTMRAGLYQRLIAPAAALLAGATRLYLAPHGPLHYVPFQALTDAAGATLARPGGPEIVYGLSASLLFTQPLAAPLPERQPCLALGFNGLADARLRYAESEARGIAALTDGHALTGAAARRAVLEQAGGWRWLHFSCHGHFDALQPLASALHLAAGERLTAQDVIRGPLLDCDLVSLSACESGLSRIRRGDELIGLVHAFFVAGARAVLCSLWQVDEISTRILMEHFYTELLAGASPAAALQRAQSYLRRLTHTQVNRITELYLGQELLPELFGPAATRAASVAAMLAATPTATDDDLVFADPLFWAPFILVVRPGGT